MSVSHTAHAWGSHRPTVGIGLRERVQNAFLLMKNSTTKGLRTVEIAAVADPATDPRSLSAILNLRFIPRWDGECHLRFASHRGGAVPGTDGVPVRRAGSVEAEQPEAKTLHPPSL